MKQSIKWVSLAWIVALLVLIVVTRWWAVRYLNGDYQIYASRGRINAQWTPHWNTAEQLEAFHMGRDVGWDWSIQLIYPTRFDSLYIAIPFWSIAAISAPLPILLFWRDRRRAAIGHCSNCGYDLAKLQPENRCPECGNRPPKIA